VKRGAVVFQHLRLASINQNERPPGVADVKRLIVLIQNENRGINHETTMTSLTCSYDIRRVGRRQ
jgi:hypothetical protein